MPSASATTQLVRISLVAINSMLMAASARARNIRAAVPARQAMPAPTALTRAMAGPSSRRAPGHWRNTGARACSASGRSSRLRVKLMSRQRWLASPWVRSDCTMASRLIPASARARQIAAAAPGRSGTPRTATCTWSRSRATPRTAGSSGRQGRG